LFYSLCALRTLAKRAREILTLTEHTEATEEKASLELFMTEILINPFSAYSAGLSAAGERNIVSHRAHRGRRGKNYFRGPGGDGRLFRCLSFECS